MKALATVVGALISAAFVGFTALVFWRVMLLWGKPSWELAFWLVASLWIVLLTVRAVFAGRQE